MHLYFYFFLTFYGFDLLSICFVLFGFLGFVHDYLAGIRYSGIRGIVPRGVGTTPRKKGHLSW